MNPQVIFGLEECHDLLSSALVSGGITSLTQIQREVLPHGLAGCDILAKAKTGTGKTFAFLLPTVENLLRKPISRENLNLEIGDPIRAIILSSTRELANQIAVQAKLLSSNIIGFNVDTVLGGTAINPQKERLDPTCRGQFPYGGTVDILIATPGRLMEHIESTNGFINRLKGCQVLTLDEADQLLETGFQKNIEFIISKLPGTRQTFCFSATVPKRLTSVLGIALKPDHIIVDCVGEVDVDTHDKIQQSFIIHTLDQSLLALYTTITQEMEKNPNSYKILIFLSTARVAQFLTAIFLDLGVEVMEIHSRKNQTQRTQVSNDYRDAKTAVLLSSDISARGVDYPNVTLIIQVGAPGSKEVYVQRLGRTGRADQTGAGTLLLCTFEQVFLKQLKDLPMVDESSEFVEISKLEEYKAKDILIRAAASRVDSDLANHTYMAWLKSFNGTSRKLFQWSKQDLVNHANMFAISVLGRIEIPPAPRDVIAMMGLKDVTGLNLVDASDFSSEFDSETSLVSLATNDSVTNLEEPHWVVKPMMNVINPYFKKDAKKVADILIGLTNADVINLMNALNSINSTSDIDISNGGSVNLGGYTIYGNMVSITPKVAPLVSISRASSKQSGLASMGSMSRAASSQSIATGTATGTGTRFNSSTSLADITSGLQYEAGTSLALIVTEEEIDDAGARVKSAGEALSAANRLIASGSGDVLEQQKAQKELQLAKADLKRLIDLRKKKQ